MRNPFARLAAWIAHLLPVEVRLWIYRLGPISRLLRQVLSRNVPAGLTEVAVAAGAMQSIRLLLDLKVEKDIWLGNFEPDLLEILRIMTPAGSVAFDVGANIGLISLTLAECVGPTGSVVAFEPLPANVERLRANLALNATGERVRLEAVAVGAADGQAVFKVHRSGAMGKLDGSAGRDAVYLDEITVPVISLDDYVFQRGNPAPFLVKIDVEGGEGMVLEGASRLLAEQRPILFLELHGPEAEASVWEQLVRSGYSIRQMARGLPEITDPGQLGWKAYAVGMPPGEDGKRG